MGKLVYAALCSLDGYIADRQGNFDWAFPDAEVHAAANALESRTQTALYGRRMYEIMVFWETASQQGKLPAVEAEYERLWKATDKVVYSQTLAEVRSSRTRLEPRFDPEAVRRWKAEATGDLSIGGPTLASSAFRAGLVDEVHLFLFPVIVGDGLRALPDQRVNLRLVAERKFACGVVYGKYEVDNQV